MQKYSIYGTIILAKEGINGTVAGTPSNIDNLLNWLRQDCRLADIITKESFH